MFNFKLSNFTLDTSKMLRAAQETDKTKPSLNLGVITPMKAL
jgi:hypothetical protein